MNVTRTGDTVTLVTGDSRPVTKTWGDGSIGCPWCESPWGAEAETCPNPACMASAWADAECVTKTLASLAAEDEVREGRRRAAEFLRHDAERRVAEDALRRAELLREAEQRGACPSCLFESNWRHSPRFVRHRRPDFHGTGAA